jgi:hypothetical protein
VRSRCSGATLAAEFGFYGTREAVWTLPVHRRGSVHTETGGPPLRSGCQRMRGFGGQGRNRTSDTVIFSHVLYQLSYLAGMDIEENVWEN